MQKLSDNTNSNEIADILNHIKQKEEEQQKFRKYENVTLVLGPTGSGKSTFTQFITGNGDLEAIIEEPIDDDESEEDEVIINPEDDEEEDEENENKEKEENDKDEEPQKEKTKQHIKKNNIEKEYIIIDSNQKISSNAILSYTSFPDLMLNTTSKAAFYDCPGFDDSRSTAQDIASTYFIKKLIDSTKSLKLIFVIPHSSLGGDRISFLKFLKHVSSMFNNLQNFKSSIAIIVSKVPANTNLDLDIKISIADFLRKCRKEVKTIDELSEKVKTDSKNFITILLQKTLNIKTNEIDYPRIGIFRKANQTGLLKNMKSFQDDKVNLEKVVSYIHFSPHDTNDFGYSISSDSRDNLHELVNKINDNIDFEIATFGQKLLKYYIDEEKSSKDLQEVYEIFKSGSEYVTEIYDAAFNVEDTLNFKNLISTYFLKSNVATATDNLDIIINYNEFLKFINMISNRNYSEVFNLAEGFKDVVEYLGKSKHWYTFLIDLYNQLSKYDIQKDITRHKDVHDTLKNLIEAYNMDKQNKQLKQYLDKVIVKNYLTYEAYDKIKDVNFNSAKLKFLNDIINLTLNNALDKSPDNQSLVVKGPYIKISDIINQNNTKLIKLFALNTVFIDTDLNKTGDHVQLFIIAPKMEIINDHKIVLDGKPTNSSTAECAKSGYGYGQEGKDGEPGKTGDSAGNFFAVVDTIIDGDRLTISANGSNGGPGQCGGNGSDGRKGINAERPERSKCSPNICKERNDCTVVMQENNGSFTYYIGIFNGTRVGNGGNGGNGGRGGFGGNPGEITVIQTSDYSKIKNRKEIKKYNEKGANGNNGKGGIGGKGWFNGNDIIIPFYDGLIKGMYPSCGFYFDEQETIPGDKKLSGNNGTDGDNVQGLIQPKNVTLDNPAFIINQYKTYLIENLNSTAQQSFLRSYLIKLEDKKVTDYYDTLGLINELDNLEKQYLKHRISISILPLYESLLKRVQEYAEKNDKQDEKIVLDYLIAAIFSKMYRIQEYSTKSLIINLKDNLKSLRNEIGDLKDLHSIVQNNEDQKLHDKLLFSQIEEAESLIETDIKPAVNNNLNNIDNEIESMCNKIIQLQNETEEEKRKLKKQRDDLNEFLALKSIFDIVMTATEFITNFAVPMLSVAETVMVSKTQKGGIIGPAGTAALGMINSGLDNYTKKLKTKVKSFADRLSDAWAAIQKEALENHSLFESNKSLKTIFATINEVKGTSKGEKKSNIDEKSVHEMFENDHKVAQLLENESNNLEKMKSDSKGTVDIEKALGIINKVKKAFSSTKPIIEAVVGNQSGSNNPFDDSIKKVDAKLKELSMFEQNIYDILIPQYNKLQNEVTTIQDRLKNESSVALSISNWKMQSTIQDIGNELQKLSKTFLQLGNIEHFLNKLAKAMSLLTEVYDRIQETLYKSEFAAFVTKISNNQAMEANIKNPDLNKAIRELDFIIKSNIVIEKYESAKNAFDLYVFPYGGTYLKMFKQPSITSSYYETLVVDVTKAIKGLENQLSDFKTTLNDPKSDIRPNKRFGNDVPALFEWKHSTIKPLISKLFGGEQIELKADIMQANTDKNAIKVNEIQIDFKPQNEKIKNELYEVLQKFEAELIHVGNSYYRCDNNVYRIPSKKVKLSINFHQQDIGKHRGEDAGSDDLALNDAVLSPYGTWQIKLSTNTSSDFDILKNYENQVMNIELLGKGSYIKFGSPYCNDDLKYTYSLSDELTEDNKVDSLKEAIQNSETNKSYIYNKNNSRRRRSIEKSDTFYINEENQFITSGAYSNTQSSFINNIFNSMRENFVAFENLNPVNLVTKWLNKNKNNFDHVMLNNDVMEKELSNYPSLVEIPKSSELIDQFIADKNSHDVNFISNSLLNNHGNLLLLDLIIRSKNKLKYNHQNIEVHNNSDSNYAQKLAYKEYMPLQHAEYH